LKQYIDEFGRNSNKQPYLCIIEVINLLGKGEDNQAKLLWLEKVVSWDFNNLSLWSSEEQMFYCHLNDHFQLKCLYTCPSGDCNKENEVTTMSSINILFTGPSNIEEALNIGRRMQLCPYCRRESLLSHSFVTNEPLPLIVFSMSSNGSKESALQEFYTIMGHRYKVFAYSVYASGHFISVFRRGKLLLEYDGLTARQHLNLKKRIVNDAGTLNILWLIYCPSNSFQV